MYAPRRHVAYTGAAQNGKRNLFNIECILLLHYTTFCTMLQLCNAVIEYTDISIGLHNQSGKLGNSRLYGKLGPMINCIVLQIGM